MVEAKQRVQLQNSPTHTPIYTKGRPLRFSTLTPSKLFSGQEWESVGGAAATEAASTPPRWHHYFTRRLLFRSGLIL